MQKSWALIWAQKCCFCVSQEKVFSEPCSNYKQKQHIQQYALTPANLYCNGFAAKLFSCAIDGSVSKYRAVATNVCWRISVANVAIIFELANEMRIFVRRIGKGTPAIRAAFCFCFRMQSYGYRLWRARCF